MATKKTTKATAGRPKKAPAEGRVAKTKKVNPQKPEPTEDEIRRKAEEIYHDRVAKGEYGTAEDDWHKAEKILKGL
jgi:hypothetical protein